MEIILGHMIGDYVLQFDWMAYRKKEHSIRGLLTCILHCLIWTISVYIFGFLSTGSFLIFMLLFLSHFLLDRTNLVKNYCTIVSIMSAPPTWKLILVDNTLHLLMIHIIRNLLVS